MVNLLVFILFLSESELVLSLYNMKKFLKNGLRFLLVTVGIVVLTSFTIDATDALNGSQSALSILAGSAVSTKCPEGMVRIDMADKSICMDIFENSVGEECGTENVTSALDTKKNIDSYACQSVSVEDARPWTFVSLHQAKTLCAKRSLRIPSASEWYESSLGTPDTQDCNIDGGGVKVTGSSDVCVSARGMHDMIGNVWEWVDESIKAGVYHQRTMPDDGYVSEVDESGIVLTTSGTEVALYDADYYWNGTGDSHAMMRGGFFGAGTDAGLFSVHTKITPSFSGIATGFRCVGSL